MLRIACCDSYDNLDMKAGETSSATHPHNVIIVIST